MGLEELGQTFRKIKGAKWEKKLPINKPESFDGELDSTPTYWQWRKQMDSYLRYHRGTWDDDADLLIIVSSCMKGAAREWFDNRAEDLCEIGKSTILWYLCQQ